MKMISNLLTQFGPSKMWKAFFYCQIIFLVCLLHAEDAVSSLVVGEASSQYDMNSSEDNSVSLDASSETEPTHVFNRTLNASPLKRLYNNAVAKKALTALPIIAAVIAVYFAVVNCARSLKSSKSVARRLAIGGAGACDSDDYELADDDAFKVTGVVTGEAVVTGGGEVPVTGEERALAIPTTTERALANYANLNPEALFSDPVFDLERPVESKADCQKRTELEQMTDEQLFRGLNLSLGSTIEEQQPGESFDPVVDNQRLRRLRRQLAIQQRLLLANHLTMRSPFEEVETETITQRTINRIKPKETTTCEEVVEDKEKRRRSRIRITRTTETYEITAFYGTITRRRNGDYCVATRMRSFYREVDYRNEETLETTYYFTPNDWDNRENLPDDNV